MRTALDDSAAPPVDDSIARANKQELTAAARRWDDATAIASSLQPPKKVAAAHRDMVAAMKELGTIHRQIAAAAPNKRRTKRLGKRAQTHPAAKRFADAVSRIEKAGFAVLTVDAASSDDPLAGASSPEG